MKKKYVKEPSSPHNRKPSNLKTNFKIKINKSNIKQPQGLYHSTTSSTENNQLLTKEIDNKVFITEKSKPKSSEFQPPIKIKLFQRDIVPQIDSIISLKIYS